MNIPCLFISIIILLFSSGCENEPTVEKEEVPEVELDLPYKFSCEENSDSSGIKTLFLLFEENKVALNSIPICEKVSRKLWNELGIPKNAVEVRGGKWATGSAFHYSIVDSLNVKIFQIGSDELDGEVAAPKEIYSFEIK